jgi:hypothetical protein
MSVARVTEITTTSKTGFEDAIRAGVARANGTLRNVSGGSGALVSYLVAGP